MVKASQRDRWEAGVQVYVVLQSNVETDPIAAQGHKEQTPYEHRCARACRPAYDHTLCGYRSTLAFHARPSVSPRIYVEFVMRPSIYPLVPTCKSSLRTAYPRGTTRRSLFRPDYSKPVQLPHLLFPRARLVRTSHGNQYSPLGTCYLSCRFSCVRTGAPFRLCIHVPLAKRD